MRSRAKRIGLVLYAFVAPDKGISPSEESSWQRGKREADELANGKATLFMIISAPIFGVGGLFFALAGVSWPLRVPLAALIGLGVALAVVLLISAAYALCAPYRQRDEARLLAEAERNRFTKALQEHKRLFDENDQNWRKASEAKWGETERLRGLLGEAENTIRELRSRGATLESETPNIVSRLLNAWEDKSFDHPDHCKFGGDIEVTNRERDRASVRFALIFHSQTMHSESEQDEPPIQIDGRETKRVTVSFYFPKMFVGPFRTEGGGPPHASSMKLALRELISDTERVSDVRP